MLGAAMVVGGVQILRMQDLSPVSPLLGPCIWRGPSTTRAVALTFDDGPDPKWTPGVLQVLKREHVRATFFLVGENAAAYPGLVLQEKSAGCEIGNHTWDHPDLQSLSIRSMCSEVIRTQKTIARIIGPPPTLFRAPYGARDPLLWPICHIAGLSMVGWSLSPWHGPSPSPESLVADTLRRCRPGEIILLHDSRGARGQTVQALPMIIDGLKSKGYTFVTVSELIGASHLQPGSLTLGLLPHSSRAPHTTSQRSHHTTAAPAARAPKRTV